MNMHDKLLYSSKLIIKYTVHDMLEAHNTLCYTVCTCSNCVTPPIRITGNYSKFP